MPPSKRARVLVLWALVTALIAMLLLIWWTKTHPRPYRPSSHVQVIPPPIDTTIPVLLTVYDSVNTRLEGGSLTKSGKRLRKGMIAADLDVFPLGTMLYIVEFGIRVVVEDCGGAIKGRHIDLFVPGSARDRRLWRRETVNVKVVNE